MLINLDELKRIFENIKKENITFDKHFWDRVGDRPYLTKELIFNSIKDTKKILGFQKHEVRGEERYRVAIKLSNRYTLVIIIKLENINLYIKTAWKTSRKWQKSIQK